MQAPLSWSTRSAKCQTRGWRIRRFGNPSTRPRRRCFRGQREYIINICWREAILKAYGARSLSVNNPVQKTAYGKSISFNFLRNASLCLRSIILLFPHGSQSNCEGTKSFTPAALAHDARASWWTTLRRLRVEITTSIPSRAASSEEVEV